MDKLYKYIPKGGTQNCYTPSEALALVRSSGKNLIDIWLENKPAVNGVYKINSDEKR